MAGVVVLALPQEGGIRIAQGKSTGSGDGGAEKQVGLAGIGAAVVVVMGANEQVVEAIAIHIAGRRDGIAALVSFAHSHERHIGIGQQGVQVAIAVRVELLGGRFPTFAAAGVSGGIAVIAVLFCARAVLCIAVAVGVHPVSGEQAVAEVGIDAVVAVLVDAVAEVVGGVRIDLVVAVVAVIPAAGNACMQVAVSIHPIETVAVGVERSGIDFVRGAGVDRSFRVVTVGAP